MLAQTKNIFSKNTWVAVVSVTALLLLYHITRPFWLYFSYKCFIDMSIKFCIDFIILLTAWKGAKQNRKKRNQYVLLIMFFYYIGDMFASFSPIPSAIPYAVGHILLIYCIINTCIINKWQYVLLFLLAILSIPIIMHVSHVLPELTLPLCLLSFVYGVILISKFCLSMTNRFFRYAAVLFLISDTVGFLRISVLTELTPIIDYTAYVVAILFYGLSTYNCSRKDVVCFSDVTALSRALSKKEIKFFIYGDWSRNLFLHRFPGQSAQIEIMYDGSQSEPLYQVLDSLHYHVESCTSNNNKTLYSEKWGYLHVKEITIQPDNNIVYINQNNNKYILDSEYIHTLHWVKTAYPCVFPTDENDRILEAFRD